MSTQRATTSLLSLIVLAACADSPTSPELMQVESGPSFAVVQNEKVPFSFSFTSPCTGETVVFSGTQHQLFRVTEDEAGGFHVGVSINWQNVTGTAPSGTKYQIPLTLKQSVNFTNGATTATATQNFRVVAQGNADDWSGHILFHVTITPDGTVTAEKFVFDVECSG